MSFGEIFVIILLIIVVLKPEQQKLVISKLKRFYAQLLRYKQGFQQTINNKLFCNVDCVENSKKQTKQSTNIVDYDPFTDNFIPNIKKPKTGSKNKHKLVKNKSKRKSFQQNQHNQQSNNK